VSDFVFNRTHALPAGPSVRLRLARMADYAGIERLLQQRGAEAFELGLRRLLRFDPSRRTVIAAFAPVDGVETLVGVAAIDHRPDAEVDTLVVDERLTDGLGEVLVQALTDRSRSRTRRRVA
jgi:N-acetylglutamate synthase-like GNAT family acetyltransferase